jgi:putative transposase
MAIRWPAGDCHAIAERRKLHDDLLDQGETYCPNRVARPAGLAGIKARIGYRRRPGGYGGTRAERLRSSGLLGVTVVIAR